jgi:MFS family permease
VRLSIDFRYVRLLSAFYVATFAIRMSFGISVITFTRYVDADPFVVGLVVAASPVAEIATVLWVGVAIDRYGRRSFLLAGLLTGAAGLFLLMLTRDIALLAILNGLHGVSAGLILVSSLALLADYAARDSRGREMGVFDFVNLFGWIVGLSLGYAFAQTIFANDLRPTFAISGTVALIGFVYAWFNVREPQKERFTSEAFTGLSHLREAIANRRVAFLIAPWFTVFLFISSLLFLVSSQTGGPSAATEGAAAAVPGGAASHGALPLDFSNPATAALLVGGGIGFLFTQILFGRLSDRYGRVPIMGIGAAGFFLAAATIGAVVLTTPHARDEFPLSAVQSVAPLAGIFGFMALAFGPSALAALADAAKERAHGTTMALYSLVVSAGWSVGPPATGALVQAVGIGGVVAMFLVASASMPIFVALLAREHRRVARAPTLATAE